MLADGTNVYLYGVGRVGEQQPGGWQYHRPDALGSVRQLEGASAAGTLSQSYEPFGMVLVSSGSASTAFQFTGEQVDGTGLIFLRSRLYAPEVGRFITPDSYPGNRQLPQTMNPYSYTVNNPANLVDPSGHYSLRSMGVIWPSIGKLVEFAEWTMSKRGLINCDRFSDDRRDSRDDVAFDLFVDFVCEYGPKRRRFTEDDYLTSELAASSVIHQLRRHFYRLGGQSLIGEEWRFNAPQYGLAFLDLAYVNIKGTPVGINLTHFLGSFNKYEVQRIGGKIRFTIENRTDRSSFTHIPARFPPEYFMYLETEIEQNPDLYSANVLLYTLANPVISVLKPMAREETSDYAVPSEGGGNMSQIFTCEEIALDCGEWRLPWPLVLLWIDIP